MGDTDCGIAAPRPEVKLIGAELADLGENCSIKRPTVGKGLVSTASVHVQERPRI